MDGLRTDTRTVERGTEHTTEYVTTMLRHRGFLMGERGDMMDTFRVIYRILRILQRAMDCEEFDAGSISAEALGLSGPKWCRLMAMLLQEGWPGFSGAI